LWTELMKRHGKQAGTRQMINVLALGKQHRYDRLRVAVESALDSGSHDVSAVRYLLTAAEQPVTELPVIELGLVERYERPLPMMNEYDQLLTVGGTQ
jgi:hypothetical protein